MFKKVNPCPFAIRAFAFFYVFISGASAQVVPSKTDSVHSEYLHEVLVNGHKTQTSRAAFPIQIISDNEISTLNASTVADAAKHFAGVTVKDYGGIGGLKTVSIRGLGAQHTGVSYDGVMLSDAQTGQIDLNQFSIENIAEISLTNGQPNNLLQPARMFASSGVLSFSTSMPDYDKNHTLLGNVSVKTGSFGLINPLMYICKNVSKKWAINLSANGLTANGVYKFQSNINRSAENLVEKSRLNSDVHSIRTELNSNYSFSSFEFIDLKIMQYYSERGLPGADIMYASYATDRLLDKNFLSQFKYQNRNNCYFQYQFSGKINRTSMIFTEESPNYSADIDHTRNDNYTQNEYYLSAAFQKYFGNKFTISGACDWWYNNLYSHSNMGIRQDAAPTRHSALANIATKYVAEKLTIGTNLLYTLTRETNHTGASAPDRNKLSPALNISYKLLENKELRCRAFYKNIFRLPTFNDLYYHDFGYANLLPETTNQFNVGITYLDTDLPFFTVINCSLDAYYNRVSDKISIVYGMPFSTIRNIGRVDIKGSDVSLKLSKQLSCKSTLSLCTNYSFQLAQDYSKNTDTYLEIIPYAPIHTGSGSLTFEHGSWECGYNYLFSGIRYSGQNTNRLNLLKSYWDHSIFGRVKFKKVNILAEAINLANTNYEVVQFYPMPGRNYRLTISYKF